MRLKNIGKFQEGGAMPPQDPAAAPAGGDPMQEILMGCQQAVETQDCQVALQVCQIMLEMAGGGAAPAEAAPLLLQQKRKVSQFTVQVEDLLDALSN